MKVNWRRTRVKLPADLVQTVRFVYDGSRAAVWKEESGSATRIAYSDDATFTLSRNIRVPHRLSTPEGDWEVVKLSGGCCGSSGVSFISQRKVPVATLLDPDVSTL